MSHAPYDFLESFPVNCIIIFDDFIVINIVGNPGTDV